MLKRIALFLSLLTLPLFNQASAASVDAQLWALDAQISSVRLSPSGNHLALIRRLGQSEDRILEVYDANDLEGEPYRVNADPMEIQSFFWVSDAAVVIQLRQRVRDQIDGFNRGVFEYSLTMLDIESSEMTKLDEPGSSVVSNLPFSENEIMIRFQPSNNSSRASSVVAPSYYRLDLETGRRTLVMRGSWYLGRVLFTPEGEPWLSSRFDETSRNYEYLKRVDGEWEVAYSISEDSFDEFSVVGYDVDQPNLWFVGAFNGRNTRGMWEFDTNTNQFKELIYGRNDVDVLGSLSHTNGWANPSRVVGLYYFNGQEERIYFDPDQEAWRQAFVDALPHAGDTRIISESRDGSVKVVYNSSSRDPGTYYLFREGRLSKIASRMPHLSPEVLSDVSYITYEARDGRTIPGFITVPQGEGPFPLIVMPHGGPFVGETVLFDKWAQMLANSGYMVLQPQYRGSMNYGLDHYMTAFIDGGQGGYQMQDDKDDGALYLVEQGLVDPDRIAMFGWSYGGYAALVAASREEQIYQCAVAGAAVADNILQLNYYVSRLEGSQLIEQRNFWRDSISPIDEVDNVNIPLLVVHGSVDQRVPLEHAERYLEALDEAGKLYQYLELDGADHFSNTLTYDHQLEFYTKMLDFLANDCGPGGL